MIIGTDVTLLPFDEKWLPSVLKWVNQPELRLGTGAEGPVSDFEHRHWYEKTMMDRSQRVFVIGHGEASNSVPVGLIGLKDLSTRAHSAEYWIYIGEEDARRKGVAREATRLVLDFGFNSLGLHRIYLKVLATNEAALALYRKLGFTLEGTLRDHSFSAGKFVDMLCYAVLEEEFRSGFNAVQRAKNSG
jgi:RimJ/RimL family protein N-acetyltransferase